MIATLNSYAWVPVAVAIWFIIPGVLAYVVIVCMERIESSEDHDASRIPAGLDAGRTPLAEALHTQRLALAVIVAAGVALLITLAACVLP